MVSGGGVWVFKLLLRSVGVVDKRDILFLVAAVENFLPSFFCITGSRLPLLPP